MLLFQKRFHRGLLDGSISLTFRAWATPRVKKGGRYRVHPIGVVEVDSIDLVLVKDISPREARASGFASRAEFIEYLIPALKSPLTAKSKVFRVALRHGGDGDRVPEALDTTLTQEQFEAIRNRLKRFDVPTPWTQKTFRLIDRCPRVAASQLAIKLKWETEPFKICVRKLKKLGLTQSFEVGYEITPRGRIYLEMARKSRAK